MSKARPENGRELRIGVLIIGSLLWDPEPHREDWRRDHLDMDKSHPVRAPIRYGRRSTKRGCSYTMVFSPSLAGEDLGHAMVVPCSRTLNNADAIKKGIVEEAENLWLAERRPGSKPNGRISADWGCVALVKHPGLSRELSDAVCKAWEDRVRDERCDYGQLNSAVDEEPAVDRQSGLLNIPWPTPVDGSDFPCDVLLATATNPTIVEGRYPTAQEIADAWNTPGGKPHVNYFRKNRARGITTFQDRDIEEQLRVL